MCKWQFPCSFTNSTFTDVLLYSWLPLLLVASTASTYTHTRKAGVGSLLEVWSRPPGSQHKGAPEWVWDPPALRAGCSGALPHRKHRVTLRSHPNTILLKTDSRLPQKLEKNLLRHKTSVPTILKKCRSRCSRKSAVTPNSLPCSCSISIPLGALGVPRRMQSVGSLAFFFFSMYLHVAVV